MKFAVVELYREGIRLPRETVLAAGVVDGELRIAPVVPGQSVTGTALQAHLTEQLGTGYTRDLLLPIFDVRIRKMSGSGFVIAGIQLSSAGGVLREFPQEWWVRQTKIS